jgi:o-succinylbenzoate---CoA ligase
MKLDLWLKLEKYCEKSLIWDYPQENTLIINSQKENSQAFKELIKVKLEQISSLSSKSLDKLNIIVAESDPLNFLAAFLAGVIKGVNIFLCDCDWQQYEWLQVLKLVQPDLVFAEQQTKDLIWELNKLNISNQVPQQKFALSQESLIMIPTGGSSGKVKFAMHTWSTLSASVAGFQQYFNCQAINSFCTLPLYHVSGLMQFMRSFITQGNLIICAYKIVKTQQIIFNQQDYFISLVPTQLQYLIESIPAWLAEFNTVLLGGANISRSLCDQARKLNIPLAPTYGMTETASQIVTLKPKDFLAGNNSSGQVLPHAEIMIKPKANSIGLINLKCASLCLGYYPQVFHPSDLFTTDDLGSIDVAGYLYLSGRNSQKIITGGENVFPAEVETAILATKLVKDLCIIGISDRHWGQIVTAVYVPLKAKQSLDLIKSEIKLQIAKYKQPKIWIEVNSLPRNNRGKINYHQVKEIAYQAIANQ